MHSISKGPDATTAPARNPGGLRFALAGMLVGLLYTAVSMYWALGGTALLDTVGGALEQGDVPTISARFSLCGLRWS